METEFIGKRFKIKAKNGKEVVYEIFDYETVHNDAMIFCRNVKNNHSKMIKLREFFFRMKNGEIILIV